MFAIRFPIKSGKLRAKLSLVSSANAVKSFDPELIVEALDRHIIGQQEAKRAVAIAFRNRYRRRQLDSSIQKEIMPANILMKGNDEETQALKILLI